MKTDTKLGLVKVPLLRPELETAKEYTFKLERSLDPLKNDRDKKERGTITVKVSTETFEPLVLLQLFLLFTLRLRCYGTSCGACQFLSAFGSLVLGCGGDQEQLSTFWH
jgi:hypothetical protein